MNIAILGTGGVGQTLAGKLVEIGQDVVMGTRDAAATQAKEDFAAWYARYPQVRLATFADAAAQGEILMNATSGSASLAALEAAGAANMNGKILIDISNPLDFSRGMPPSLFVSNTDSLGEQIQRAFPEVKVVKALNTVTAGLMVEPRSLAGGEHDLFISGDDAEAKATVTAHLQAWFGWKHIIDMGGISAARGAEMMLLAWVTLYGVFGTPNFNFKVVR